MTVAAVLKGKSVHPEVSLTLSPGSRRVFQLIANNGTLADLIEAGTRVLEAGCGPCIGMGQAPPTDVVSVRSFNRNFPDRSGTANDRVYLASPAVCAATALFGEITDPRRLGEMPSIAEPEGYPLDANSLIHPPPDGSDIEIIRGPNIQPLPTRGPLEDVIRGQVLLKVGDDITTDHIMPAGAAILPLRSNIPAISRHVFEGVDPTFAQRAKEAGGGFIVGGTNYGQGSSREHAALAPMYLGVKAVLVKDFSRIHQDNLVNSGILPLRFAGETDYEAVVQGDEWEIDRVRDSIRRGEDLVVRDLSTDSTLPVTYSLTERQRHILLAGGLLNYIREGGQ
jgi:aconitate hydratase